MASTPNKPTAIATSPRASLEAFSASESGGAASSGADLGDAVPRILVFDPVGERAVALAARLRRWREDAAVVVVSARREGGGVTSGRPDVALVNFVDGHFEGLAYAAELQVSSPWTETVYWFDDRSGELPAPVAATLDVRRQVPLSHLLPWLAKALGNLTRMARAGRVRAAAERALPPVPAGTAANDGLANPLPEAERMFREAYLRRLLSQSPNRTMAARRAGVPYTTFCSMLKKLGLT